MSHYPKLLPDCSHPTVACQCGWSYTIDPETKQNIYYALRMQECYPGDFESHYNGYLLGVHAMHVAQLVTNRLDGKKETTWAIQDSRVETQGAVEHNDGIFVKQSLNGRISPVPLVRQQQQYIVSLTCRVPVHPEAIRFVRAVIEPRQLHLLIPQ